MTNQINPTHKYSIIPRSLIFLRNEESVLLIQGSPHKKLWANLYNGVGGHIEQGEDIFSSAYRELFEETGLVPDCLYLCGIILINTEDNPGIGIFVFTGESNTLETNPSSEGNLVWVNINEIYELDLVKDLPVILPRVLNWKPCNPPFSAIYQSLPLENERKITFFS